MGYKISNWVRFPRTTPYSVRIGKFEEWANAVKYVGLITVNTLRSKENDRHFLYDIFKRIFLNKNMGISLQL